MSVVGVAIGIDILLSLLCAVMIASAYCAYVRHWMTALAIGATFSLLTLTGAGTQTDMRPDCGDVRISIWGVPCVYDYMDAITRQMLTTGTHSHAASEWVLICRGWSSDGRVKRTREYYRRVTAWSTVSAPTASAIIEDLGVHVRDECREMPYCSIVLFWPVVIREREGFRLSPEWRQLPEVKEYLMQKRIRDP